MTLWGEPEQVHAQNVDQLQAHDCHQNVTEPQAIHVQHRNCESGLATCTCKPCCTQAGPAHAAHRLVQHMLHTGWSSTCCR